MRFLDLCEDMTAASEIQKITETWTPLRHPGPYQTWLQEATIPLHCSSFSTTANTTVKHWGLFDLRNGPCTHVINYFIDRDKGEPGSRETAFYADRYHLPCYMSLVYYSYLAKRIDTWRPAAPVIPIFSFLPIISNIFPISTGLKFFVSQPCSSQQFADFLKN